VFNFSFWDIILILMVALIIFGPKKLPEIANSLGKAIAEFRKVTGKASNAIESTKSEVKELEKDVVGKSSDLSDKKLNESEKSSNDKNLNKTIK